MALSHLVNEPVMSPFFCMPDKYRELAYKMNNHLHLQYLPLTVPILSSCSFPYVSIQLFTAISHAVFDEL